MRRAILLPITMASRFTVLEYVALNFANESTELTFRTSLKISDLTPVFALPQTLHIRPKRIWSCFNLNKYVVEGDTQI